jgi:hypothetical protein
MNRDTSMARWYRRVDPACFSAQVSAETNDEGYSSLYSRDGAAVTSPRASSPTSAVPAAFKKAWEPQPDERGLTRLRAIFGRS